MQLVGCVWLVLYTVLVSTTILKLTDGVKVSVALEKMSLDAQQTLLDQKGRDALNEDTIKGVTFLYRMDLPSNYVAYYEVVYNDEYYIVSAGNDTGDYDVPRSGNNTAPSKDVRASATDRGLRCRKFYVFTTLIDLMCADKDGKFIATDIPDIILVNEVMRFENTTNDEVDVSMFDSYIRSVADEQAEVWKQHAKTVEKMKKDDETPDKRDIREFLEDRNLTDEWEINLDERQLAESFDAKEIIPGNPQQVVVGSHADLVEVRVKYVVTDTTEKKEAGVEDHQTLCRVMKGCEMATVTEDYAVLSNEHLVQHKFFVDIELGLETAKTYQQKEFVFAVDIIKKAGSVTTRYFAVSYTSGKGKRATTQYYQIRYEQYFPDYYQFWNGPGDCVVGCVPVAWAMVFGYYDRRSHLTGPYGAGKALYRSGMWGAFRSSSQVAPATMGSDTRVRNWIRYLSIPLQTFCDGTAGSTYVKKKGYVYLYFKHRHSYGNARIAEGSSWDTIKDRVRRNFPVLISRENHSPVVTKIHHVYNRYRHCVPYLIFWTRCHWHTTSLIKKMYLRMGWGRTKDRWVAGGDFRSHAAVY